MKTIIESKIGQNTLLYSTFFYVFITILVLPGCQKKEVEVKVNNVQNIVEVSDFDGFAVVLESISKDSTFSPVIKKLEKSGILLTKLNITENSVEKVLILSGPYKSYDEAYAVKEKIETESALNKTWILQDYKKAEIKFSEIDFYTQRANNADEILKLVEDKKISPKFRGFFNEPFININIFEKEIVVVQFGLESKSYLLLNEFDPNKEFQTIVFFDYETGSFNSDYFIEKKPATDDMSGMIYPYSVTRKTGSIYDLKGGGTTQ